MKVEKHLKVDSSSNAYRGIIDEPSECPLCGRRIKPVEHSMMLFQNDSGQCFVSLFYLCKGCYESFVAQFSIILYEAKTTGLALTQRQFTSTLQYIGPRRFTPRIFDDRIAALSSKFVEVYNQALEAEVMGLSEIAGIGYRKALEFLIKDYLILVQPEAKAEIEGMFLGNCINEKVKNEKIMASAKASAWIGNDFTHYLRKYEDKDIEDLKAFIDATVYWVAMELITDQALQLPRQK